MKHHLGRGEPQTPGHAPELPAADADGTADFSTSGFAAAAGAQAPIRLLPTPRQKQQRAPPTRFAMVGLSKAENQRVYRAMFDNVDRKRVNLTQRKRYAKNMDDILAQIKAGNQAAALKLEARRDRNRAAQRISRELAKARQQAERQGAGAAQQPEGASGQDARTVPAPVPPRDGLSVAVREPQRDFGDIEAKVYEGVKVDESWVTAARFMLRNNAVTRGHNRAVEGRRTRYAYVFNRNLTPQWNGREGCKKLEKLKDLERVLAKRATMHVGNVEVELELMIAREYTGGPTGRGQNSEAEVVHIHTDMVYDGEEPDRRAVVSVVFVLEGGFKDSGYDVRIHGEDANGNSIELYPQLETGDQLFMAGGEYGVAHDVGFFGDPSREEWKKRLTIVAFYAVGKRSLPPG